MNPDVSPLVWAGVGLAFTLVLAPLYYLAWSARLGHKRSEAITSELASQRELLVHLAKALEVADTAQRAHAKALLQEVNACRTSVEQGVAQCVRVARDLHQVVGEADGSFRHLTNSMKDLDNLQVMGHHVERLGLELAGASAKIQSQLETSGRVVEALHGVVDAWSKERAPLEQQAEALARQVDRALTYERDERHQLRLQLNALLLRQQTATGDARK